MAFAPESTYFDRGDGSIIGCFTEKDKGHLFEYSSNKGGFGALDGWPHRVWVTTPIENIDSGFRYARVLKTVAYIVVDEDEYGDAVIEKWSIKKKRIYKRITVE